MEKEINATVPGNDVSPEVWAIIHEFLLGINDPELDLREPHLKPVFAKIYPFIIFFYALLVVVGLLGNLTVFVYIIRHKMFSEETYTFLLNNAISDIVKCVVVLPISLYVLMIHNWVLGELLCSFLPMIQKEQGREDNDLVRMAEYVRTSMGTPMSYDSAYMTQGMMI